MDRPSLRAMPRAMVATPRRPARNTTTITTMPVLWMSSSGTNWKSASDWASCGPWLAYMKIAKKAARRMANSEPRIGLVYIVRARWVRS